MRISDWSSDVCSSDLQVSQWLAQNLVALAAKLGNGSFGKINQPAQRISSPEPAEPGLFAAVEQFHPAYEICFGNGIKRPVRGLLRLLAPPLLQTSRHPLARKIVVSGTNVSVRVELGGRLNIKKKKKI